MTNSMGIIVYLVLWWLMFLIVFPLSRRRAIPWGTGAKLAITTVSALGFWLLVYGVMSFDLITVKAG